MVPLSDGEWKRHQLLTVKTHYEPSHLVAHLSARPMLEEQALLLEGFLPRFYDARKSGGRVKFRDLWIDVCKAWRDAYGWTAEDAALVKGVPNRLKVRPPSYRSSHLEAR